MAVEQSHDLSTAGSGCPDPEDLAAYLEGTLDAASRDAIEAHLADCARCRAALADSSAFLEEEEKEEEVRPGAIPAPLPFRRRAWRSAAIAALAAAAALVLVARLAPQWVPWGGAQPELQALMAALANEPTRPVEGRLAAGFAYAPPPTVTRGSSTRELSPEVRIAALNLQSRVATDAAGREALGLAHLVSGNVADAIAALEAAAQDRASAEIDANLAAAYLAQADLTANRQDLSRALGAADRALTRNPALPAALFNRALALERLGDPRAPAAWQAALQAESDPGWRDEIARRIRR